LARVKFQSHETTLTDAQISEFSAKIVASLVAQLGAQLRAAA
jgi:phenylalanyl-tRNA synthetase beta subunit